MQGPQEAELQEGQGAYQEVTPEEAADVLELMEEHEPLLHNSMALAEQLGQELQELDEVWSHGCGCEEGLGLWAALGFKVLSNPNHCMISEH